MVWKWFIAGLEWLGLSFSGGPQGGFRAGFDSLPVLEEAHQKAQSVCQQASIPNKV